MNGDASWSTLEGPFCGNAAFKALRLRPPLSVAWKHAVTTQLNAGLRVGGGGRVIVLNGETGVESLDLASGTTSWNLSDARRTGGECVLAGEYVLAELPDESSPYGVRLERYHLPGGRRDGSLPVFLPVLGAFEHGGPCVRLSKWVLRLDGFQCEPAATQLGRAVSGRLFGLLEEEGPSFFVACRELATDAELWRVPHDTGRFEDVLCVTEQDVVTHAETRGGEHWIRVREARDGALRWDVPSRDARVHTWPVTVAGGLLHRWEGSSLVANDLATGEQRWSYRAAGYHSNHVVTLRHVWFCVQVRDAGFELIALHRGTGEYAWSAPINAKPRGLGLALIGDSLLVTAGKTLTCWRT